MSSVRQPIPPPGMSPAGASSQDAGPLRLRLDARLQPALGWPSSPAVDGELLGEGRYVAVDRVAEAADRFVIEVFDRDLKRVAWMHVLRAERARAGEHRDRFLDEARVLGALAHPALPAVWDLGMLPGGEVFYTHRPPAGRSAAVLATDEHAPVGRVELLVALATAARALDQAGRAGLVHEALSAEHLGIGDDGEVWLWGLRAGERPRGDADPWPEVRGLGEVLYHLLAGVPPDDGPTPPREQAPERGVPHDLEALCLRCLGAGSPAVLTPRGLARALLSVIEGDGRRAEALRRSEAAARAIETFRASRASLEVLRAGLRTVAAPAAGPDRAGSAAIRREIEDAFARTRREAEGAAGDAEDLLFDALERDPRCGEAVSALADLYFERFLEAERVRDEPAAARWERAVRRTGRGRHDARLDAPAPFTVRCHAPGSRVEVARMEERGGRRLPGRASELGPAPLEGAALAPGSYLVVLNAPGCHPAAVPVLARRGTPVDLDVRLLPAGSVGPDWVHVPEGPALLGGDPDRPGDLPAESVRVPGFLVARVPVTWGEWAAFVEDLARDDREAGAARIPWDPIGGRPLGSLDAWGRVRFAEPSAAPFPPHPRLPVTGVTREDARAYAAWRGARTGISLRLPHIEEWEKAGRGADGRLYPWGDRFDAAFCRMRWSVRVPAPAPVGACPEDVSPYGVRDLAGSVMEWCEGWWDEARGLAPVRGGSWMSDERGCRLTRGVPEIPLRRFATVGFRLARDLPPE